MNKSIRIEAPNLVAAQEQASWASSIYRINSCEFVASGYESDYERYIFRQNIQNPEHILYGFVPND